jgi:nucleotide-binding universal stress UspA family protein
MNDLGIRTIVVPIDDSDQSERALPYARFLAARLGVDIRLLAVAGAPDRRERLERALDHAQAQLVGQLGDTRVAYDFWTAERIVAATSAAHAVACIATRWPTGPSMARQVVFHSERPVLLVGPCADRRPALDGTVITAPGDNPNRRGLIDIASVWSRAIGLTATLLAREGAETTYPFEHTIQVVDTAGTEPVNAILEYERHHQVSMVVASVPAGWARRLSKPGRAAGRLIRVAHSPVLAVTYH